MNPLVSELVKIKVKFNLEQATKAHRESRGIALSLTLALDRVVGQCHALAVLPPGKTRCPSYRGPGRSQGWSGRVQKISPPPSFDPRSIRAENLNLPAAFT